MFIQKSCCTQNTQKVHTTSSGRNSLGSNFAFCLKFQTKQVGGKKTSSKGSRMLPKCRRETLTYTSTLFTISSGNVIHKYAQFVYTLENRHNRQGDSDHSLQEHHLLYWLYLWALYWSVPARIRFQKNDCKCSRPYHFFRAGVFERSCQKHFQVFGDWVQML